MLYQNDVTYLFITSIYLYVDVEEAIVFTRQCLLTQLTDNYRPFLMRIIKYIQTEIDKILNLEQQNIVWKTIFSIFSETYFLLSFLSIIELRSYWSTACEGLQSNKSNPVLNFFPFSKSGIQSDLLAALLSYKGENREIVRDGSCMHANIHTLTHDRIRLYSFKMYFLFKVLCSGSETETMPASM